MMLWTIGGKRYNSGGGSAHNIIGVGDINHVVVVAFVHCYKSL